MNRLVAASVVTALSIQLASIANGAEPSDKPNVLMICIDDLNDWVGFLGGHPEVVTPHMDALEPCGRRAHGPRARSRCRRTPTIFSRRRLRC